jgi:hypothetical protein
MTVPTGQAICPSDGEGVIGSLRCLVPFIHRDTELGADACVTIEVAA